jgi:hypothetical protein
MEHGSGQRATRRNGRSGRVTQHDGVRERQINPLRFGVRFKGGSLSGIKENASIRGFNLKRQAVLVPKIAAHGLAVAKNRHMNDALDKDALDNYFLPIALITLSAANFLVQKNQS